MFSRNAIALVVGCLLALSFPKAHLAALAWLVPALALLTASQAGTGKRRFFCGWWFGLGFNLAALYWLWFIPVTFFPILGWLALSAWQALYYGLWVWLSLRLAPVDVLQWKKQEGDIGSAWYQRTLWAMGCAAIWVALEMVMARMLSGFPWLTLGVSQYRFTPLIQMAEYTGVYGVSFLVIWFSVSLLNAISTFKRGIKAPWSWLGEMVLPLGAAVCLSGWGFMQTAHPETPQKRVRTALIQPSIPQTVKWDEEANRKAFATVLKLSKQALELKPELMLWPEAVTPGLLRYDKELQQQVETLAKDGHVWLVLGADDAVANEATPDPNDGLYYNSSFLISPQGGIAAKHDKQKLVMFGEYVPLAKQLPFLKWLTPIGDGFTPGTDQTPFAMDTLGVQASVLICFEDIFPHYVRIGAAQDVNLLVNLTNDGWLGQSSAQWQHAANSVFRAVENRRTLVRCTNNGLTCWVDPWGRQSVSDFGGGAVYQEGFEVVELPIYRFPVTFYTRNGDVFGWGCVGLFLLLLARAVWGRKLHGNKS